MRSKTMTPHLVIIDHVLDRISVLNIRSVLQKRMNMGRVPIAAATIEKVIAI